MVRRRKIGLIYEYNENWIGGTYYIQNLISALKQNDGPVIPELYIYTDNDEHFQQLKAATQYPFLYRGGLHFIKKFVGNRAAKKLSSLLLNKKPLSYFKKKLDFVFPAAHESWFHPGQPFIYWIPDFQEHYLPEFFSQEDLAERKSYQLALTKKAKYIIFSSRAVQDDFNTIYPGAKVSQFVLPFAVTHPQLENNVNYREKYALDIPYFICCNQFWKHKNHFKILDAVKILKEQGKEVHVVFTGKEQDYRNPLYFGEIKDTVQSFQIGSNVSFLGFINREDQLSLISSSLAVIQPSLFEGWSTVVEDAKSLKVNILASDLKVHREQLQGYPTALFFDPLSGASLAEQMNKLLDGPITKNLYDYNSSIAYFGKNFMTVINEIQPVNGLSKNP
ncbi:MAG: glycosyltransferase family 4 protein [Ferruginibacter sp.]|nr:glycosyltransferase family 4 protein [Ferruginibacter sp.]